jgi:DNA-binding CsgD family transcriptional regulator
LTRYRLLETVRHYALDRLVAAGEAERLRDRHRDAFVALAERVEPELLSEREPEALELLDAESANLYAAGEWAAQTQPELALRLYTPLALWWRLRGLFAAGDAALAHALEVAPADRPAERARALWARGYLAVYAADYDLVREAAGEALAIGEELEDEWIQGRALHALAYIDLVSNPRAGIPTAERSRELARAAGDDFVLADATQVLSFMRWMQDDYEAARREGDVCFEIAERIGNRDIMAFHWLLQAITPWGSADFDRRLSALERCLATSAEVGDPVSDGFGTAILGLLEIQAGGPDAALARLERGRERVVAAGAGMALATVEHHIGLAQAALGRLDDARAGIADVVEREADGYSYIFSLALSSLAAVDRLLGEPARAHAHAERALETAGHVGSPMLAGLARHELGRLAAGRGEWAEAEQLLQEELGALVEGDQTVYVPDSLEALAEVAAGLESYEEAARLLAAASRARADIGIVRWIPEHERWNGLAEELREALGDEAYEVAAAEGRVLNMDEAVAYARRARGSRKRPPGGWESLTPTELEVARHAAAGLTNPEIGRRMFISRGTVKVHLAHIYAKLGVRNRAELTAEATRREASAASG